MNVALVRGVYYQSVNFQGERKVFFSLASSSVTVLCRCVIVYMYVGFYLHYLHIESPQSHYFDVKKGLDGWKVESEERKFFLYMNIVFSSKYSKCWVLYVNACLLVCSHIMEETK